jgi:molybdate transport system ATP-binding protein
MSLLSFDLQLQRTPFTLAARGELPARGVIGVFGHSGSGKTTLLRCLAGLERAQGRVQLGDTLWQDDNRLFCTVQRRGVGFVFQTPRLFPHLSVRANLRYGYTRTPASERQVQWQHAIDVLDLTNLLDRRVPGLSAGEQQRVAIGRALLSSPGLLLMDEPLAALDVKRKREILPFIRRVALEFAIPVVMVSHSVQELLQVADTLLLLDHGRVIAAGDINRVLTQLPLLGYFGDTAGGMLHARVAAHEPEHGLTRLECHGQALWVPQRDVAIDQPQRVFVAARNVSIALQPVAVPFSVLNVLTAVVVEVGAHATDHAAVLVKLDIGAPLLASITRKSLALLNLAVGQRVYAYVKAVSLEHEL